MHVRLRLSPRVVCPAAVQVIPSLQPDLEDPELVRKKAIKARQKEFSRRLNEVRV